MSQLKLAAAEAAKGALGTVPAWVWGALGGGLALALAIGLLVCISQARQKRRRRARLEDVQTVFQTETWRKLE